MPKLATPLSEAQVSSVKAKDRPFKLFDGKGLHLLVTPSGKEGGSKYWHLNYSFKGKRKTLALGVYPEVTLDEARIQLDDSLMLLAQDIDPSEVRRQNKAKEKATISKESTLPSVRLIMDGGIEIRKGRAVVKLTNDESLFVTELLNKLR
jgi:hypothetical protein